MIKTKILVIDDEEIVLDSCKLVLEDEGFSVFLISSVSLAFEVIEKNNFSLILIDVKMPEKDGITLTREIKEKWPDIPIVLMSGFITPEMIANSAKIGAADLISKPFTPDELFNTVLQVIQKEEKDAK